MTEPNTSELQRLILELKEQLSKHVENLPGRFGEYVLTRVYEADDRARTVINAAMLERIQRLEDERVDIRRSNRTAILSAVSAVAAAIAMVVIDRLTRG